MTDLMHYEKGCSPSAIQRKYSLTYEQGYELAERLKKTQELELEVRRENTKLKELLKECKHIMSIEKDFASCHFEKDKLCKLLTQINQALGEE